jgi:hypothetical protein
MSAVRYIRVLDFELARVTYGNSYFVFISKADKGYTV